MGERYRSQGDLMSLVLLYESTQAELDYPQVGRGSPTALLPALLGELAAACALLLVLLLLLLSEGAQADHPSTIQI